MTLTVGSLFSGVGGIDLGFAWAGFETRWFCEIDDFCRRVLAKHWPEVPCYGDIRTLNDAPAVDVIAGGFPCQPFSYAGKRRGAADDRHLWPEMRRVVALLKPRWVVCENVAGFLNLGLDDCLTDLESEGYEAWAVVFPAGALQAWHRRDRVFVLAHTAEGVCGPQPEREREAVGRAQDALGDGEAWALVADADDARRPQQRECLASSASHGRVERHCGWATEPGVGRVVHGIPDRVDRLEALGNAVVPQCAEVIARAILAAERAA